MKAQEWSGHNSTNPAEYKKLHKEFEGTLRDNLKKRFDRFAVLHHYNHQNPQQCLFSVEHLKNAQIPGSPAKQGGLEGTGTAVAAEAKPMAKPSAWFNP